MKIFVKSLAAYVAQFNKSLNDAAKNVQGIVYSWKTESPISRAKGESPIITIGQSIRTFRDRYKNSSSLRIERTYFDRYYKHFMKMYGPIPVDITKSEDPNRGAWEAPAH